MTQKLFIGGLSFQTPTDRLRELFGQIEGVQSVTIVTDRLVRELQAYLGVVHLPAVGDRYAEDTPDVADSATPTPSDPADPSTEKGAATVSATTWALRLSPAGQSRAGCLAVVAQPPQRRHR